MTQFNPILKKQVHRQIARLVGLMLRTGAVYDPANFEMWQERGYHVTPVHYYSPIPDTRQLRNRYPGSSSMIGLDLRPDHQLGLMINELAAYSGDCDSFSIEPTYPNRFYLANDAFTGVDPFIYFTLVRKLQPERIIEIGSGHSTLLGVEACRKNYKPFLYSVIDPYPREFAQGFLNVSPHTEHVSQNVEELDVAFFEQLKANDILFVDSSHTVRTGGDVAYIVREVLPRLASGVVVHFHDIFLPFEYPTEWVVEIHRFWTEQFLLQAYLTENPHVEVLFASFYMSKQYPDLVRQAFPRALSLSGGSFWFRRC